VKSLPRGYCKSRHKERPPQPAEGWPPSHLPLPA
jgi:hypothetical protein